VSIETRNRLRVVRAERRISQETLAIKVGVSQAQMSKIERGTAAPDTKLRRRIAKVLKVDVTALGFSESAAS
jgi:DNA-binding XRE family transcriptional regulator